MSSFDCLRVPSCYGECSDLNCKFRFNLGKIIRANPVAHSDQPLPPDMLGSCLASITGLLNLIPQGAEDRMDSDKYAVVSLAELTRFNLIQLGVKSA